MCVIYLYAKNEGEKAIVLMGFLMFKTTQEKKKKKDGTHTDTHTHRDREKEIEIECKT